MREGTACQETAQPVPIGAPSLAPAVRQTCYGCSSGSVAVSRRLPPLPLAIPAFLAADVRLRPFIACRAQHTIERLPCRLLEIDARFQVRDRILPGMGGVDSLPRAVGRSQRVRHLTQDAGWHAFPRRPAPSANDSILPCSLRSVVSCDWAPAELGDGLDRLALGRLRLAVLWPIPCQADTLCDTQPNGRKRKGGPLSTRIAQVSVTVNGSIAHRSQAQR